MKVTFAQVDRETLYLLPPSIQEWLPEQHLARFVVEIVEQINLQPLKASYCGRGSQPYNPEMLVALLFYGYATGVFSSRKLERSTYDSVAFRYIAANRPATFQPNKPKRITSATSLTMGVETRRENVTPRWTPAVGKPIKRGIAEQ